MWLSVLCLPELSVPLRVGCIVPSGGITGTGSWSMKPAGFMMSLVV